MSEFAFQQALVRLLTDSALQKSFLAGDRQTLVQSGFSVEQLDRLEGIDAERLTLFAEMVVGQRVKDSTEALPMTARILGEHFAHLVVRFFNTTKLDYGTRREAPLAFAGFLKQQFQLNPPAQPFLQDVLEYETISIELLTEAENESFMGIERSTPSFTSGENLLAELPFRLPCHRIVCFAFDVPAIIKQLKAKQVPLTPEPQTTHLILHVGSSGTIQQSTVNRHTISFIEACDGATPLRGVVDKLFDDLQEDASHFQQFRDRCTSLCMALVERRIIGFKDTPHTS